MRVGIVIVTASIVIGGSLVIAEKRLEKKIGELQENLLNYSMVIGQDIDNLKRELKEDLKKEVVEATCTKIFLDRVYRRG